MKGKYLLLGSNLGNRFEQMQAAKAAIEKDIGQILANSSIYETKAWGHEQQPDFLNQVVKIETELSPESLLSAIARIEQKLGRKRFERWHERSIDIDILFYDNQVIKLKHLLVPHPEIPNRRFTLAPLEELCADENHPELDMSIKELLDKCEDTLEVVKLNS